MKDFLVKIIRDIFCLKRNIMEEIVNIEFKEIAYKHSELNCFNSNDLWFFINQRNDLFKEFFINEEKNEKLNFLKVDSISASKSKGSGYRFDTIYSFGKNVLIDRKMNWDFENCINHIKYEYKEKPLRLYSYKWNNRYEWKNSDGSHHFAAANFLATNNSYEQIFNCNIKSISINNEVANNLLGNYEMFVFNISSYIIEEIFKEDIIDIIRIQDGHIMVLFDKDKSINKGYINLLKLIDKKYALYFNDYLESRLKYQDTYLKKKAINAYK